MSDELVPRLRFFANSYAGTYDVRTLAREAADRIAQLEAALKEIAIGLIAEDGPGISTRYLICANRLCGIARLALTSLETTGEHADAHEPPPVRPLTAADEPFQRAVPETSVAQSKSQQKRFDALAKSETKGKQS